MSKILKLFSQNKKVLILAMGTGLFLLLAPFYFVEAISLAEWCGCEFPDSLSILCWLRCLGSALVSLPIRIFFAIIVGIVGIGALIAGFFYVITVALVNWLMRIILQVGIVPGNPATPEIVEIGWTFARDFANMFFILALVFIGLATVLRIKEYEMKKALPTLIIIALLINFTPVIVGFVVDMGNIVTNFFLEQIGSISTMGDIMDMALTYLKDSLPKIFLLDGQFLDPNEFPQIMAQFIHITVYGTVLFIFFHLAIFIYILIGAVFFFRTVILWILMILAPIAFLSKVFPNTRTTKMIFPDILHWDKWWQSLIQWTIIGIPISFFLYLSSLIMFYKTEIEGKFFTSELKDSLEATHGYSDPLLATIEAGFIEMLASLLAPTLALVLLGMGALISLKAAPEGAQGIMRFTHEKGIKKGWSGIKAGYAAAGRSWQTYRTQIKTGQTQGQALRHTLSQPILQTLQGWKIRKKPAAPAGPSSDGTPLSDGSQATVRGAPSSSPPADYSQETGDQSQIGTEDFSMPITPAPSTSKGKRIAKKIGKKAWTGIKGYYTKSPKAGLWAATGILKTIESMATQKIDNELKAKKGKGQKTCSNPICREEINADAKFCGQCGQAQS